MDNHFDISVLETLLLAETALSVEERARIRRHLESCALCRETLESLQHMYKEVEKSLQAPPTEEDRLAAMKVLPRAIVKRTPERRMIDAFADAVEPYKQPFRTKLSKFMAAHPYQTGSAVVALAAALAVIATVTFRSKDQNPTYAEIKNHILYAYNRDAEVIWKKAVLGSPDWTSRTVPNNDAEYRYRYLSVEDVDGDNTNEVLLTGATSQSDFAEDTLYCFEGSGRLRWKAGAGPMVSFGHAGSDRHKRPVIVDFIVMRKNARSKPQIFVVACEQLYSPTKLFEVSASDGRLLQSFSNRGGCVHFLHKDIDSDGNEELLLGGVNDGFNLACLAVLDPSQVDGVSPLPQDELPSEGRIGREKYYILFPRWDIGSNEHHTLYNYVKSLVDLQGGGLDVRIGDAIPKPNSTGDVAGSIFFRLASDMTVGRIIADDTTIGIGDILFKQGKITAPITPDTYSSLKDSVLYWDGSSFVHTPTINRKYGSSLVSSTPQ
jgi:hypothetical protein